MHDKIDLDRIEAWDFELPEALIAHAPAAERSASALLVCPGDAERHLCRFADLPRLLRPGDLLVFNDARVVPCRLFARRPTGGQLEVFVLPPADPAAWHAAPVDGAIPLRALVRASRPVRPGQQATLEGPAPLTLTLTLTLTFGEREPEGDVVALTLHTDRPLAAVLEAVGAMPLPPYIVRRRRTLGLAAESAADRERYQTVYARQPGAVAAPTAGLHFTPALLDLLQGAGVDLGFVTLDVGMGTFKPLDDDRPPSAQTLHAERYTTSPTLAAQIEAARQRGGRIIAVGTTSLRALEDQAARLGAPRVEPGAWSTQLFIRPGYHFRLVDALITNFHLPRSSLLMLVAAFGGYAQVRAAYADAIARGLRFYSYGDAMLLYRQEHPTP